MGSLKSLIQLLFSINLENNDCIKELPQDSPYRRFEITDNGREYFSKLRQCHELFAQKNHALLKSMETEQAV